MTQSEAFKIALVALSNIGAAEHWTDERRRQEAQSVLDRIRPESDRPTLDEGLNLLVHATSASYRQATRLGWECDAITRCS